MRVSMLESIDLAPAAVHEIVIVGHRLANVLVRRERLLHGEEIIDSFNSRLGDDGPVRLSGHIGEQTKRLLPLFFQRTGDHLKFLHHRPHLPWLAVQNLSDHVHDVLLSNRKNHRTATSFAADTMWPMLLLDMK